MCFRRKLDAPEALVAEARSAGLDVERFRAALDSNAIVEAFGADLEETRALDAELPFLRFGDELVAAEAPYAESPIRWPRWRGSGAWRPPRSRLSATCPSRAQRPSCGGSPSGCACARCGC